MFSFKKYILLSFAAILTLSGFAAAEPTAQEFLERARNPKSASTYGMFGGTLQHRRRGEEPMEMPVFFGVVIENDETIGRVVVVVADRKESYTIHQIRKAGREGTSVVSDPRNSEILNRVGLRISDLTMSFLHYKLVKELDGARLSAIVSCRVLLLESPDDQPGGKEYVRVYLEKERAFPLKAEFLRTPGDKKPFRLVEANGFTKKNDLYYARTILVEGPGWRTKVEFEPKTAAVGLYDRTIPKKNILYPELMK